MTESRFKNKAGLGGEDGLIFVKPADLARGGFTGIVAEGELVGTIPNRFNEEKDDFKIIADTAIALQGKTNDGEVYSLDVAKGDTLIVNGAGNLNYLMRDVSPGTLCQINYLGKKEIESGTHKGTLAHNFEVMYE